MMKQKRENSEQEPEENIELSASETVWAGDSAPATMTHTQRVFDLERMELGRNAYRAFKRDLIGMEKENVGEIVMLKCSGKGDYFEVAEHSALIYYYYVCQPLKIKNVRFEDDYDSFFEQYQIGRIRTRGTEVVRRRLKEAGLYDGEYVMTGRLVFTLKRPLSEAKLKVLEKRESKRRLDLNKTIEVSHSDPLFYRNLSSLLRWMHRVCSSKMSKLTSNTLGKRMVDLADELMMDYFHSTDLPENNFAGRVKDWTEIRIKIYKLKYTIQVADVAGIWTPEVCLKAFEKIEELRGLVAKNLTKALAEQRKNKQTLKADVGENEKTEEASDERTAKTS